MNKLIVNAMVAVAGMATFGADWPTVQVTELADKTITVGTEEVVLDAAYRFTATDRSKPAYDTWNADFVVTFSRDVTASDVAFYGKLLAWSAFPLGSVSANTPTRLISNLGMQLTYADLLDNLSVFDCGAKSGMNGLRMTVELRLFNPQDASDSVVCAAVTHQFGNPVAKGKWFDAKIAEYAMWPADANKAAGGEWQAGTAALEDVANVTEPGVLNVTTDSENTLLFEAFESKAVTAPSGLVIESELAFSPSEIGALPAVESDWKCGVLVGVDENETAYYYGLAQCGTTNGWVKLDGPVPTEGTVPLRMKMRLANNQPVVIYNINGVNYTAGGKTALPIVATGDVAGVVLGGSGSVRALSAGKGKSGLITSVK